MCIRVGVYRAQLRTDSHTVESFSLRFFFLQGGALAAPVWADLAFEGADDLTETMRKAYAERQIPADCGARTDATFSNNKVTESWMTELPRPRLRSTWHCTPGEEAPLKAGAGFSASAAAPGPVSPDTSFGGDR